MGLAKLGKGTSTSTYHTSTAHKKLVDKKKIRTIYFVYHYAYGLLVAKRRLTLLAPDPNVLNRKKEQIAASNSTCTSTIDMYYNSYYIYIPSRTGTTYQVYDARYS